MLHSIDRSRWIVMGLICLLLAGQVQAVGQIDLTGPWKFKLQQGATRGSQGDASQGYQTPQFDDHSWSSVAIGTNWEDQGHPGYNGIAWYRRQFTVPASWQGKTLILQLGNPDDAGEVYFNGKSLGTWDFKTTISCKLPADAIAWGKTNTLAIRVWDWYKNGGVHGSDFSIQCVSPFDDVIPDSPASMPLTITDNLPDDLYAKGQWEPGWRDAGMSDTRPKMSVLRHAYEDKDAVQMDVWHPNGTEYIDAILAPSQTGAVWEARQYSHITFWYRTDHLKGDMSLHLTAGKHVWGKNAEVWQVDFPVAPSKDWQRVVLPFDAFEEVGRRLTHDDTARMTFTGRLNRLVIGYENHCLQAPGQIAFAGFEVGRFAENSPFFKPISLNGLWLFKKDDHRPDGSASSLVAREAKVKLTEDHLGYGEQLGFAKPDFNDQDWYTVTTGTEWFKQVGVYRGPAWYRQKVIVPAMWEGRDLKLNLGSPSFLAKVYWNGKLLGQTTEDEQPLFVTIPSSQVQYGKANQIAVQVTSWRKRGGLVEGPLSLSIDNSVRLLVAKDHQTPTLVPAKFEMGTQVAAAMQLAVQWQSSAAATSELVGHYRLVDCFHKQIIAGQAPLKRQADGSYHMPISLDAKQSRQLYFGEWFHGQVTVLDSENRIVDAQVFPSNDQENLKLQYAQRDALSLPVLPEKTEATPYGQLKLVDVIDCAVDPLTEPHPYKEGGIRNAWVGRRAYATWENGVTVETFKGRSYREVNNNQFFAYRVGRGQLKPHVTYLLRVLVPDNKARYQVMEIKAGRNTQGTGFRSGISPDDPDGNYPHMDTYQWYDHFVVNDDVTYGFEGSRTTGSQNGFWVVFHDNGRAYTGLYEAGPAAAEIRLYEVTDVQATEPVIRYPQGLPHRVLMMDWERQPEMDPADVANYVKLMGTNVVSPVIQKWAAHAFWDSKKTSFAPPGWYKAAPEGMRDQDIYQRWLDTTKKLNVQLVPRIEYGGSPTLPAEAHVIGPNGKQDKCGRYCQWGANILHPATWEELKTVIDEIIGEPIKTNPQITGLLWRQRQDRIKCSYGPDDVALFCKETGNTMPKGNEAKIARWASEEMAQPYSQWWQGKRAEFLRRVRDLLKSYRKDLVLYYYNWDEDGWRPGLHRNKINTPQDWSDYIDVARAKFYWQRVADKRRALPDQFYVDYLQKERQPHTQIFPNLFANDKDIVIFTPVHWRYLADNEPYINYFKTGDGLAVCDMFPYEEKGRWNLQGDHYESSELTPGGHDFGMAEEAMAFFHGDPNVITSTTYTYGRGWVDVYRRFAQAFLALPDQRGTLVADATGDQDVRVRSYGTSQGTYLSVASRAMKPRHLTVHVPSDKPMQVSDLVTGQLLDAKYANGQVIFEIDSPAMMISSYLMQ